MQTARSMPIVGNSRRVWFDALAMMERHVVLDDESGVATLGLDTPGGAGPWRLEVEGPRGVRVTPLRQGDVITVGSRLDCDLTIDDPTVSGRHVAVSGSNEGVHLEDLGSKNGLFVGGARVRRALVNRSRAAFVIGRTTVTIVSGKDSTEVPDEPIPDLIGSSAPMRRLAREIRRVAALQAPVLLEGESGSGKDVVARAIHGLSGLSGRYVALNAGALGETLADSELFGHCRGAFTGAVQARAGAFEQAHRGTLFLDEVADLAPSIQVKLLRAVEDGEIRPLGATAPIKVRTRMIAASWMPLQERIDKGCFRADLYHRISTFVIKVPPLRQRKSDIPALARALLESRKSELGTRYLGSDAIERLNDYNFPGNVRELFSIVYRAAALCAGEEIGAADIEASLPMIAAGAVRATRLDARMVLDAHGGNVSAAARSARVARSTFRSWLKAQNAQGVAEGVSSAGARLGSKVEVDPDALRVRAQHR